MATELLTKGTEKDKEFNDSFSLSLYWQGLL